MVASHQESCRKDVERTFFVLQARFGIVRYPALTWSKAQMWEVMDACVIMYNMIIQIECIAHDQPYDQHGPFANIDHKVSATLFIFSPCMLKCLT